MSAPQPPVASVVVKSEPQAHHQAIPAPPQPIAMPSPVTASTAPTLVASPLAPATATHIAPPLKGPPQGGVMLTRPPPPQTAIAHHPGAPVPPHLHHPGAPASALVHSPLGSPLPPPAPTATAHHHPHHLHHSPPLVPQTHVTMVQQPPAAAAPPRTTPVHPPTAAAAAAAPAAAAPAPASAATTTTTTTTTSGKSKKGKKNQPTVTMATAATATPASTGSKGGENTGRWTAEEHRLFLQGLEQHGKGWKKIASLIKSRTVVQIRTHAQKYFQKLAKARQNGEEGEVAMEGRGGGMGVPGAGGMPGVGGPGAGGATGGKRRRQVSGTKRKAITSVVASAQREGKKMAAVAATNGPATSSPPPLPAVAPALQPFVVPAPHTIQNFPLGVPSHGGALPHQAAHAQPPAALMAANAPSAVPGITTMHGTISGQALEDSLFRFLTPATGDTMHPLPGQAVTPDHQAAASPQQQALNVNSVAAKAGANPITLPSAVMSAAPGEGEISPTGVADLGVAYPSWAEAAAANAAPPAWYARGADVDELLNEADALDWLADSGDLQETYVPPPPPLSDADTEPNPVVGTAPSVVKTSDVASLCSETAPAVVAPYEHRNHPVSVSAATPNPVMAPAPPSAMLEAPPAPLHRAYAAAPAAPHHHHHVPAPAPSASASDLPALPPAHHSLGKIESHSSIPALPSLFSGVDMSSVVAAASSNAHSSVSLAPEEAAAVAAGVPIPKKEDVRSSTEAEEAAAHPHPQQPSPSTSSVQVFASATEAANAAAKAGGATAAASATPQQHPGADEHLAVFDAHFDEQAFVSALLENNGESAASLPALQ